MYHFRIFFKDLVEKQIMSYLKNVCLKNRDTFQLLFTFLLLFFLFIYIFIPCLEVKLLKKIEIIAFQQCLFLYHKIL